MSKAEHGSPLAAPERTRIAVAIAFALALSACGTPSGDRINQGARGALQHPGPTLYTVQRNDRLSDIALKLTGDMDSWEAIAAHNSIDNPRHLEIGAVLEIPGILLINPTKPLASVAEVVTTRTANAGVPYPTAQRVATLGPASVVVTAANPNKRFELSPLVPGTSTTIGNRQVKIVGTYYPKGIYTQPDGASRVVMRLAPGTILSLEREYDGWFKVTTAKGVGYLRTTDGTMLRRPIQNTALN